MKVKKINLVYWGSSVTLDKFILFFFLLINVGFYYGKYLFLIEPTYALLLLGFVYKLLVKRKLVYKKYLLITLLFGLYAFFSTIWASDSALAASNSIILFKYIFISFLLISLLDSKENVKFAMVMLAISGLVYALVFFSMWDISALGFGRANSALTEASDEALPNVNVVGMIVSNSFVCFLYFYFNENKKWAILLAIVAFIIIIFLGSRKSIIFSITGVFLIYIMLNRKSKLSLSIVILILIQLILILIPEDYFSFIINRFEELKFFSTISKLNKSDQLRLDFITYSVNYINSHPIFGQGYLNFSNLFYRDKGFAIYSHNNFLETMVGLGIVGLVIYYYIYFLIFKNIGLPKKLNFSYLILVLLALNLFNHFFIVVLNDRFTWILLPILYAGSILMKESNVELVKKDLVNKLPGNTINQFYIL